MLIGYCKPSLCHTPIDARYASERMRTYIYIAMPERRMRKIQKAGARGPTRQKSRIYALPEIRYQKSEIKYQKSRFLHFKNGRVLVMRMRNTNSSKMRAIIGKMGRVTIYYACAVPFESRKHARWLYCACALPKHAHFLDHKSPEICLKSEIKLDFEISYALERRVGPLGLVLVIHMLEMA